MKKKIAIICGGKSPEHEISIRSVKNIFDALDKSRFTPVIIAISQEGSWYHFKSDQAIKELTSLSDAKLPEGATPCTFATIKGEACLISLLAKESISEKIDAAFPVLHGSYGEDGTMQGLIRMMNLPLVGCDVLSSSASMDKEVMKRLFQQAQIPTAKFRLLTKEKSVSYENLVQELGSPFFIKPANAGSSVGVHKIRSAEEFNKKIADSFLYDNKVLAEEFIQGREIECSVLGHTYSAKASVPGEVILQDDFYSYETKYISDSGAKIQIPAELRPETSKKIQELAVKVFETMYCEGMARVDFFVRQNGDLIVNELNTIPGFTSISMYPKMWEASGISYQNLISELIDLAFEKFQADQKIATQFKDLRS